MSNWNQNSGYGRAVMNAIHSTVGGPFGNVFIVMNPNDTNKGNFQHLKEIFNYDPDGRVRFYTSLDAANNETESNNNDVIVLDGNSTHTLTEMLTMSNNRTHLIGLDYLMGIKRMYGQSTKISLGVTTAATDIATIKITGVRNTIRGVKVINNNTVAEGIYGLVDGGEYTVLDYTEVYKSTDMDETGAAELVANGDSSQYLNSTFGSLATARSGAVIRPNVLVTKAIAGAGKVVRDVTFDNCNFWINASNVANRFVYGANAEDVERYMGFENCKFINNGASAAIPAQNVAFGASLTVGSVLLRNCSSINAGTAMSTTVGVFIDGAAPTAATSGISVQAA